VPVAQRMTVRTQDMISWASFSGEVDPQLRLGFMSQVSPDGRHVVTTIKPGNEEREFLLRGQLPRLPVPAVFYPTRGILAGMTAKQKAATAARR